MEPTSIEDQSWVLGEGRLSGRPTQIRFRPGLAALLEAPTFPYRLVVACAFGDDGDSGMPSREELTVLEDLENRMVAELETARDALLAFVFTHAGTREWNFYFADRGAVEAGLVRAQSGSFRPPVTIDVVHDPRWDEFRAVLAGGQDDG